MSSYQCHTASVNSFMQIWTEMEREVRTHTGCHQERSGDHFEVPKRDLRKGLCTSSALVFQAVFGRCVTLSCGLARR